ncbi:hypothetical protein K4K56_006249 [Colletotrichum sp. SAR 10_98]|nr:hypothetical protein K4K56_006249 [Colletotrichum sp. SAR 10_98]
MLIRSGPTKNFNALKLSAKSREMEWPKSMKVDSRSIQVYTMVCHPLKTGSMAEKGREVSRQFQQSLGLLLVLYIEHVFLHIGFNLIRNPLEQIVGVAQQLLRRPDPYDTFANEGSLKKA